MSKPSRTADLGTVGAVVDDLRLLRSRGGLARASIRDVQGVISLMTASESVESDHLLDDAVSLLRLVATATCNRIHDQLSGQGLDVGAESLDSLLLMDVPVSNRVVALRTSVAEKYLRSPEYVSNYEDQVIQLIAREVFSTLRKSDAAHRGPEGSTAHLPVEVSTLNRGPSQEPIVVREAIPSDHDFVVDLMTEALSPFYGGDHRAHAERIFGTHVEGGIDHIGHFSTEQRMFIVSVGEERAGLVHLVGKRQGNYKISPLIVSPLFRTSLGVGRVLLEYAELYAREHSARQMYCTVAEANTAALAFFTRNGYISAGSAASQYKPGVVERMMYKPLDHLNHEPLDRPNISVVRAEPYHEDQIRQLLLNSIAADFIGIDDDWIDSLFAGYRRHTSNDVNLKYKLLYVAVDRDERVLGVVGATPKKGQPVKLMPFVATSEAAFVAFLVDLPFQLKEYGRKIYAHLAPTPPEVQALQVHGWNLDAAMPRAYHEKRITYQWSKELQNTNARTIRVKDHLLDYIREGRKTLEVRVAYDNIKKISRGDFLILSSHANEQYVRVVDVRNYATFRDMLRNEVADRIVPGYTVPQTLDLLEQLYPPRKERLGVVVIEIERSDAPSMVE